MSKLVKVAEGILDSANDYTAENLENISEVQGYAFYGLSILLSNAEAERVREACLKYLEQSKDCAQCGPLYFEIITKGLGNE